MNRDTIERFYLLWPFYQESVMVLITCSFEKEIIDVKISLMKSLSVDIEPSLVR